ncbi:MAG: hypothetical protein LBE11_01450 [Prevotellaceae bacterium]|nr:hypothetical protein [Prevotellaceae bacterium]
MHGYFVSTDRQFIAGQVFRCFSSTKYLSLTGQLRCALVVYFCIKTKEDKEKSSYFAEIYANKINMNSFNIS